METRQLRKSSSKTTSEWVKCQSKSHQGKFYLFNKTTGETKWCSSSDSSPIAKSNSPKKDSPKKAESKSRMPLPKWTFTKPARTPAQDRLKRLQSNLAKDSKTKLTSKERNNNERQNSVKNDADAGGDKVKQEQSTKIVGNIQKEATQFKEKENETSAKQEKKQNDEKIQPCTSTTIIAIKTETNAGTIMPLRIQKSSPKKSKKSPKSSSRQRHTTSRAAVAPEEPTAHNILKEIKEAPSETDVVQEQHVYPCTTAAISLGSGIVNKIKEICKSTLNSYQSAKKVLGQRALEHSIKKTAFKIPKKDTSALSNPLAIQEALAELQREQQRCEAAVSPLAIVAKSNAAPSTSKTELDLKTLAANNIATQTFGTPNGLVIPAYKRGSANSRLERLRLSLMQQPASSSTTIKPTNALCASACSSALACVVPEGTPCMQDDTDEEIEPMDWAPIEPNLETVEVSSSDTTLTRSSERSQDDSAVSEYYNTVNENLLRFAAEQKNGAESGLGQWLKDYYYFVLDTNVMLRHLTFIDELSRMKLCDTRGTILYIPYCVLQELDKLKQYARIESVKLLAGRAIKFLNANFEAKNKHIQAQSATSELEHLIEVVSPDDGILNCCLQVKQHIEHLILLTEDINLRNKAICNNILVSTKSDLVSRHLNK